MSKRCRRYNLFGRNYLSSSSEKWGVRSENTFVAFLKSVLLNDISRSPFLVPRLSILLLISLFIVSCKPTVPREIIQPDEMAEILYDYHLADAMATEQESDNRAYDSRLYRLAALKKHGVTEADFDSSMVYYTRHADRLHSIYQKVAERMEKEATALGATISDLNRKAGVEGEAMNVWPGEHSLVLMPLPLYDHVQYRVEADTAFHRGERFTLSFDTEFLFQEGSRNGIAQLVVRFKNDSVASRVMHISSHGHYDLEIPDKGKRGVDAVEALFYIGTNQNATQTTLKLMMVDNIKLLKVKMEEPKKDSTQVDNAANMQGDTLRNRTDSTAAAVVQDDERRPSDREPLPVPERRPVPPNGKPLELKGRPQDIQVR